MPVSIILLVRRSCYCKLARLQTPVSYALSGLFLRVRTKAGVTTAPSILLRVAGLLFLLINSCDGVPTHDSLASGVPDTPSTIRTLELRVGVTRAGYCTPRVIQHRFWGGRLNPVAFLPPSERVPMVNAVFSWTNRRTRYYVFQQGYFCEKKQKTQNLIYNIRVYGIVVIVGNR